MKYQPILLKPAFKDYLWGGTKLKDEYKKECNLSPVAESWELSAHKDGESIIASGPYCGKTLSEYISLSGEEILGSRGGDFKNFPILIKFIDAAQKLSIQVHPSDEYALKNEGEYGKTEVWYVLSAEEGATLYYGVKEEITKEEFRRKIKDGTLLEALNRVSAKSGDVFFIEPGTIHAIGSGLLICEIQQNSNTTYRVYDYNRTDKNGNLRELHIDKALDVASLSPSTKRTAPKAVKCDGYTSFQIAKCEYFTSEMLEISSKAVLNSDALTFRSFIITEGSGHIKADGVKIFIKRGDSVFVPAHNGKIEIIGNIKAIMSYV